MAFVGTCASHGLATRGNRARTFAVSPRRSAISMQASSNRTRREALVALVGGTVAAVALVAEDVAQAAGAPKALQFIQTDTGLQYADVKVGKGYFPQTGDLVIVKYVGYLHDGTVFDNTDSPGRKPIAFQIGQGKVIAAWDEALSGMKPGGQRRLIVPPKLAYGDRGVCLPTGECLVPPGETLEFDITLVRTGPAPI